MKWSLLVASSLAVFSSTLPAYADGVPAPTARQKQTAKDRFYNGLKLLDRAEYRKDAALYEQAYLEFVQAWATYQTDNVLWNLALSALHTKRYLEALSYFKEYERRLHVLADSKHPNHEVLKRFLAQANSMTGHVTIDADPGERIFIDDKAVGAAPLAEPVDLAPGRHVFKAGSHVAETVLSAGSTYTAKLRSEAQAIPVVSPAAAPQAAPSLPAVAEPALIQGAESAAPASPQKANTRLWWTVGLGATSAAFFAGGLYFGAKSNSAADDHAAARAGMARGACPPPQGCEAIENSIKTMNNAHTTSVVLTSIGAAAAVGAVVSWFVLGEKTQEKPTSTALPLIGPGLMGAQWNTSF